MSKHQNVTNYANLADNYRNCCERGSNKPLAQMKFRPPSLQSDYGMRSNPIGTSPCFILGHIWRISLLEVCFELTLAMRTFLCVL